MEGPPQFLSDYPYVVVRVRCNECKRAGSYRLARLAEAFGASATLERVLFELARDCPWNLARKPRKYEARCLAFFPDVQRPPSPPDLPAGLMPLRLVKNDDAA